MVLVTKRVGVTSDAKQPQDSRNLRIFQSGRHLEVVSGKFQIVLRTFPAGRLDLAELAVFPGFEPALAFIRQFRCVL